MALNPDMECIGALNTVRYMGLSISADLHFFDTA